MSKSNDESSIIRVVKRDSIGICGYSVETTYEKNDSDIFCLFQNFYGKNLEKDLRALKESQKDITD